MQATDCFSKATWLQAPFPKLQTHIHEFWGGFLFVAPCGSTVHRTAVTHYYTARRLREMCENCKSLFERQNNTNIKELSQLKYGKPQDLSKSTAVI
jgi:hypothetical protein